MTPNEIRIAEWLQRELPELHPAFENAVEFMSRTNFPGRSKLICHACRDICTEIQQYLNVEKTKRADTTKPLNQLDVLWSPGTGSSYQRRMVPFAKLPSPEGSPRGVSVFAIFAMEYEKCRSDNIRLL
jgi:hypothetical protein